MKRPVPAIPPRHPVSGFSGAFHTDTARDVHEYRPRWIRQIRDDADAPVLLQHEEAIRLSRRQTPGTRDSGT